MSCNCVFILTKGRGWCKIAIATTGYQFHHYNDVTMSKIASQIISLTIVYSTVYSDPDQTKHQSSASLAFVRGIHRGPVISPHKWPVTQKMFPFDDVIMMPPINVVSHCVVGIWFIFVNSYISKSSFKQLLCNYWHSYTCAISFSKVNDHFNEAKPLVKHL